MFSMVVVSVGIAVIHSGKRLCRNKGGEEISIITLLGYFVGLLGNTLA